MAGGILPGRIQNRVTLRVRSVEPYSSELTGEQLGAIADIAEKYGSGIVHVTPRQTVEIPDIEGSSVGDINKLLSGSGLYTGSSDRYLRNVIACSRWCLYNAFPVTDLALTLNRRYRDRVLPGKTNISLSGCDFSCVRSRTSDIGVIARADIELTDKKCKKCSLCIKEPLGCQVDAITVSDDGVAVDTKRCIRCGFCTNICKPETIRVRLRSFDIFLGGCGGIKPQEAAFYKNVSDEEELFDEIEHVIKRYEELADQGGRIRDVIEKSGLEAMED
jgi:dissimilatory sulfite reductase (desulfoviridin) alpha/beta subunit